MKEPKNNRFKSFGDFGTEEKMGVPSGIVGLANYIGEEALKALAKRGILDNQEAFEVRVENREPHPEFPVRSVKLIITNEIVPFMEAPVIVEGGYDGDSMSKNTGGLLSFTMMMHPKINLIFTATNDPRVIFGVILQETQSLFYHELLHAYEDYKRGEKKNLDDMLFTKDFISSSVSTMIRNSNPSLHPYVSQFIFCIYASASFEVRARISQAYAFIKDVTDAKHREKIITSTDQWNLAKKLSSFDAENYYKGLVKLLGGDEEKAKELISKLADSLKAGSEVQSQILLSRVENSKVSKEEAEKANDRISSNAESFEKLAGTDALKFLKYWQRKFNYEGQKSLKKLAKLTAI